MYVYIKEVYMIVINFFKISQRFFCFWFILYLNKFLLFKEKYVFNVFVVIGNLTYIVLLIKLGLYFNFVFVKVVLNKRKENFFK